MIVRTASTGQAYYYGYIDLAAVGTDLRLFRRDETTNVLLTSGPATVTPGFHTMRFKATGTNPVSLELQVDALTPVTYADSDALRKTWGLQGSGATALTASRAGLRLMMCPLMISWSSAVTPAPIYVLLEV